MNVATPKQFTIAEYHQLIQIGFLKEDDRIELIQGELIQRAAKGTAEISLYLNRIFLESEVQNDNTK